MISAYEATISDDKAVFKLPKGINLLSEYGNVKWNNIQIIFQENY